MTEEQCKITLGWIVKTARTSDKLSQYDFCLLLGDRFGIAIDWKQLNAIENDRDCASSIELNTF
ncbi:MAG: hypothetical protein HC941_32660, partial [Microcoleus sp. SU_5_3]|nr:hypothetical protein [Microcoleus sp. SU_5_3]